MVQASRLGWMRGRRPSTVPGPADCDLRVSRSQIDHLDDHKVQLKADGVTRPGQVVVIKGEGMPVFESVRGLQPSPERGHISQALDNVYFHLVMSAVTASACTRGHTTPDAACMTAVHDGRHDSAYSYPRVTPGF